MHSGAADCLNEEEYLKLKGIVERNREIWLRKAAEHGSKEAQYYLGVLLYSDSQEEALEWFRKSQELSYEPARKVLLRRAEQEKNTPKLGIFGKIFSKKASEKSEIPLELDQAQNPGFLGFSRLAKEGELEAKLFLAREYEKTGLWDQAFPLYIQVAWSGNPSVMEIVSRCYAEGKGTEKDLAAASFWYRTGTGEEEPPPWKTRPKTWMRKKNENCSSSRQKHILYWMLRWKDTRKPEGMEICFRFQCFSMYIG